MTDPTVWRVGWGVASAAAFAVAIAVARRLAVGLGMVARPNPIVRSHRAPVPYLGGAALIVAYFALLVASWGWNGVSPARDVLARSGGALGLMALGTWDDRRPFGPWFKLLVQSVLCAGYLLIADTPSGLGFGFQLLVLVTLVNAYNVIDVMDGLLCLLAAIPALALLAIPSLAPARLAPELHLMLVGLAMLLLFNRPPARVYAGDGGSLPLGFLVGAWCLAAAGERGPVAALPIAGLCAIPLLELALVIPARMRQGKSPMRGSPDHFALRLQDQLGWSKWSVLGVTTAVGGGFAAAPFAAARLPAPAYAVYAFACVATAVACWLALWRIPPRSAGTGRGAGSGTVTAHHL